MGPRTRTAPIPFPQRVALNRRIRNRVDVRTTALRGPHTRLDVADTVHARTNEFVCGCVCVQITVNIYPYDVRVRAACECPCHIVTVCVRGAFSANTMDFVICRLGLEWQKTRFFFFLWRFVVICRKRAPEPKKTRILFAFDVSARVVRGLRAKHRRRQASVQGEGELG